MVSNNPAETIKFGIKMGKLLKRGDVIALSGEFGAGKTTFIKGIAQGLGVKNTKYVNSPSFVIMKEYKGRIPVYHFDIHRVGKPSALETVGYEEYFYGDGVTLIEWADKIKELLPQEYLDIHMSIKSKNSRFIEMHSTGKKYIKLLKNIK